MWAYESVFYQIYPLGFCGAPFENDGVSEHRILKVNDWIPHIEKLGAMPFIFHRYSNLIRMVITPETTPGLIPVSVQMRTLNLFVKIYTKQESKSFWTAYSTT